MDMKLAIETVNNFDGFAKHTGIQILDAKDGIANAKIDLGLEHRNPIGSIHGGCLFTLADTIGGVAVRSTGHNCTTLSANICYLNGAMVGKSTTLYAKAEPKRIGHKIAVYDVNITDNQEKHIASVTLEYYMIPQNPDTISFFEK